MPEWKQYQEDVAAFFRDLGFVATTDAIADGARGRHSIDVLVTFVAAGVTVTWVVECKLWKRAVPKERVLVLDGVVKDLGADRGILVAESGFQAGAIRAAQQSNTTLTSLADLLENADEERVTAQLHQQIHRIGVLASRTQVLWQWTLPSVRQPDISVADVLDAAAKTLELQLISLPAIAARKFPVRLTLNAGSARAHTPNELAPILDSALEEADQDLRVLETRASRGTTRLEEQIGGLSEAVSDLLDAGKRLSGPTYVMSGFEDATALGFVQAMRAVDVVASQIRLSAPEAVVKAVRDLMRHLIDSTYLVTEAHAPDWAFEASATGPLLVAIRGRLDEVAVRDCP